MIERKKRNIETKFKQLLFDLILSWKTENVKHNVIVCLICLTNFAPKFGNLTLLIKQIKKKK